MGLKDWRVRHSMRDPVRGQFEVTGQYFAHPNGNSFREMLTGVVSGPGVAATAGEHLADQSGRYIGHNVLPVLIERNDPSTFIVLWDEIPKPDFRAEARAEAQQAADAARTGNVGPSRSAQPEVRVVGDADGSTPAWAAEMVADLARRGVIPDDATQTITSVVDLSAGRVSAQDAAHLISSGEPATAVLLHVADVPVPQQALPGPTASLCDLTLRVTQSDGTSFDAVTRLGFRDAQRRATIAVIGTVLPVRIDPHDRTRVVVDSTAYDAQHP